MARLDHEKENRRRAGERSEDVERSTDLALRDSMRLRRRGNPTVDEMVAAVAPLLRRREVPR